MKKIQPAQYKKLKEGATYTYRIGGGRGGVTYSKGKLIQVSTKWRYDTDERMTEDLGKPHVKRTLVADSLSFEPEDNVYEWSEKEKLRIYKKTVGNGLFEIFRE